MCIQGTQLPTSNRLLPKWISGALSKSPSFCFSFLDLRGKIQRQPCAFAKESSGAALFFLVEETLGMWNAFCCSRAMCNNIAHVSSMSYSRCPESKKTRTCMLVGPVTGNLVGISCVRRSMDSNLAASGRNSDGYLCVKVIGGTYNIVVFLLASLNLKPAQQWYPLRKARRDAL